MQTRRFGRTGHLSTVAILGTAALGGVSQEVADVAIRQYIEAGGNHIDVAPTYGNAEERLGPWLRRERARFFLGCKTTQRTKEGAAAELRRSLQRLQIEALDLYQLHGVTRWEDLEKALGPGGAIEAFLEAKQQGLTRYIGITTHGAHNPELLLEALRRFDFDTILFPVNFIQWAIPEYRQSAQAVLRECKARDVGVMAIKAVARRPWGDRPHTYDTWYEPFDDPEHIQPGVNFALSQDVTGLCTTGDVRILPLFLQACQRFTPLSPAEQEALLAQASSYETIFVKDWA